MEQGERGRGHSDEEEVVCCGGARSSDVE
jgi:hypothetical protein